MNRAEARRHYESRPPHPVDERGLAEVPAGIVFECVPEACTQRVCRRDVQHVYHPAAEYQTETERTFRSLGCFTIRMCRTQHELWDNGIQAPPKPSEDVMRAVIDEYARGEYDIADETKSATFPIVKPR